jgi:hypothetical protein
MTSATPDPTDDQLATLVSRSLRLLKEEVPSWATQRALDVWRAPAPAAPGLRAQVVALLRFDSWQGEPALALRTRGAAPRQLLYAVGAHDIDLRVQAQPGEPARFEIIGQVLGPATRGAAAWQTGTEAAGTPPTASAALDEFGEFLLGNLPAGPGRLHLTLDEQTIELPPIELGSHSTGG